MKRFPLAHATHPQWRMAAALVVAQLRAQMSLPGHAATPPLGLLYITDHYAAHARDILGYLSDELPEIRDWAGTVGVGICATGVEYFDEPAMAVMACDLSPQQYRVFSGVAPLPARGLPDTGFQAHTALIHADGQTADLPELVAEMASRTATGYLFGGLSSSRGASVQFAQSDRDTASSLKPLDGVFAGGMSGVAFASGVQLVSRVTQGARPIGAQHVVTQVDGNVVLALDGRPALGVLLEEAGIDLNRTQEAMARLRSTLVGLSAPGGQDDARLMARRQFGDAVEVRHIIGLDPARRGVAIADRPPTGTRLAFCERHVDAARADLVRICTEIREELEPQGVSVGVGGSLGPDEEDSAAQVSREIVGAVYVSCSGRGGPHFGGDSAELQVVRRSLGDVPLIGFFAGGEIARHHLYGYTGVLTVFTAAA
ncbi:MAG: hypothetical protein PWQ61_2903 [Betaproteobacteria bacterium]|nr:hypothetical protein [Betaproteobacteria bacterium]